MLLGALTLLSAWRLLIHFGSALPSDLGDPILGSWIFWWNTHTLPLSSAWWNAPMFSPLAGTFAFSETLLAMAPLSTPLQWIGVSPVATHNALYLLSYPMAGLGAYLLAFRITKNHSAAMIAALAYAFNPYRVAQLPHIQIQWSCWMPFGLAALHDYVETHRPRALVAFGACWLLNGLTNAYFLMFFPVLVGLWALWFVRRWRDAIAIGAAALVASLPIVPVLLGYLKWQRFYGLSRPIGEIRSFAADLSSLLAVAPRDWLPAHWGVAPGPEGELYPGLTIVALTVAAVIMALRQRPSGVQPSSVHRAGLEDRHVRRWTIGQRTVAGLAVACAVLAIVIILTGGTAFTLGPLSVNLHRSSRLLTFALWFGLIAFFTSPAGRRAWRDRSALAFYGLAAGAMFVLAMGPEPHAGSTQILYKAPYEWLMRLPGFDGVRVPARFGLLMILCLCQSAAVAIARLKIKPGLPIASVAAAVLAEGWIVMPVAALPPKLTVPARARTAGTAILELPIGLSFESNTIALLHQIDHKQPIVNGFSGYVPRHYEALATALNDGDPTALAAIRETSPIAVFVDASKDTNGVAENIVTAAPGGERLESTDRGLWYFLPQLPRPAEPASAGAQLAISNVAATNTADESDPSSLIDGNLKTRWYGHIHGEVETDTVTLTFREPAVVDVVEFDQSLWTGSYPRDLEIILVTSQGEVSAFRGPGGGLAVRASLDRTPEAAMRIAIAAAAPATAIKLISHPKGARWTWSVGEIKIFGK